MADSRSIQVSAPTTKGSMVNAVCHYMTNASQMLFFGTHCERLCQIQFSLISLIPGLMRHLGDCADPHMDRYAQNLVRPTSLKTSERSSLLAYMGLPLQIFGKGSLFGPYTPLQKLDTLADQDTKSYLVGSTNALLLQQRDRYADVLINLDDNTININSPSLRTGLALSTADRRWIDFLTQAVQDTWDEKNPSRPKDMGYAGSEEFIRLQFEEYLLALVSAVKYKQFVAKHKDDSKALLSEVEGDPSAEYSNEFINSWAATENYALFNRSTDSHLFDIVEPRHPCAGGLTIEDVQRRLAQQVQELHLDERWRGSKEVLGTHLATGQQRVSSAVNKLWGDIEAFREAQRKRAEEQKAAAAAAAPSVPAGEDASNAGDKPESKRELQIFSRSSTMFMHADCGTVTGPDLTQAQATVQAASSRAGAYLSSWGAWAAEKRKKGWAKPETTSAGAATEMEDRPAVTTVSELAREDVHAVTTRLEKADVQRMAAENEAQHELAEEHNAWAGAEK